MNKKFYPYLWFLEYIKSENISFTEYNPYLELSSNSLNAKDDEFFVNLSYLNLISSDVLNIKLQKSYIVLLAKIRYAFLTNNLLLNIDLNDDYYISKWKYKKKFIEDDIYIFLSCIKDVFSNYVVYYKNKEFLIYLDYEKNEKVEKKIKRIIEEFLPLTYSCVYIFDHFLIADINDICMLNKWEVL